MNTGWTGVKSSFVLILALLATGCVAQGGPEKASAPPGEARAPAQPERPAVSVDTSKVEVGDLSEGLSVTGTLTPKYQSDVKSEYTGIVSDIYVTEWVRVSRGTPLAKLDTREAEVMLKKAKAAVEVARSGVLQAQVGENRAKREYERAVRLKEAGLATQQMLDDALSARDAAAAQTAAAGKAVAASEEEVSHADTRLAKAVIRAPMDGVVSMRGVNVGDLAGEMGSPKLMFQIVDNRLLELTVTLPDTELSKVRVGQALQFTADGLPGQVFEGRVKFINPSVNTADRAITLMAEVRNDGETLKGGLYVRGTIVTGKRAGVPLVPRESLQEWDIKTGVAKVFAVEGGSAKRKEVRTGALSDGRVEILSGVAPGETVVTRGAFNVRDGDRLAVNQP